MVLASKVLLHQPLNRQSETYAREGVDIDVSTLATGLARVWWRSARSFNGSLSTCLAPSQLSVGQSRRGCDCRGYTVTGTAPT
jgi:transposase